MYYFVDTTRRSCGEETCHSSGVSRINMVRFYKHCTPNGVQNGFGAHGFFSVTRWIDIRCKQGRFVSALDNKMYKI